MEERGRGGREREGELRKEAGNVKHGPRAWLGGALICGDYIWSVTIGKRNDTRGNNDERQKWSTSRSAAVVLLDLHSGTRICFFEEGTRQHQVIQVSNVIYGDNFCHDGEWSCII